MTTLKPCGGFELDAIPLGMVNHGLLEGFIGVFGPATQREIIALPSAPVDDYVGMGVLVRAVRVDGDHVIEAPAQLFTANLAGYQADMAGVRASGKRHDHVGRARGIHLAFPVIRPPRNSAVDLLRRQGFAVIQQALGVMNIYALAEQIAELRSQLLA